MFLLRYAVTVLVLIPMSHAAPPRAVPMGEIPADVRMLSPKDLDGYFPFQPATSQEAWSKRAEEVRQRILVSQGLWPMPSKTPLNARIYGRIEREDYSIEKVHFESAPRFFVTGNLYRPTKVSSGKVPGSSLRMDTGPTLGCRLPPRQKSPVKLPRAKNVLWRAAKADFNPCAFNLRGWVVWCGNGICSAIPIPNSYPVNWCIVLRSNGRK